MTKVVSLKGKPKISPTKVHYLATLLKIKRKQHSKMKLLATQPKPRKNAIQKSSRVKSQRYNLGIRQTSNHPQKV